MAESNPRMRKMVRPSPELDDGAREHRADDRSEPDDHADQAQREAMTLFGIHRYRDVLDERQHDAIAARLQKPRRQKDQVIGRDQREHRPHDEEAERREEELARVEAVDEETP
jgi:hypothetical protein